MPDLVNPSGRPPRAVAVTPTQDEVAIVPCCPHHGYGSVDACAVCGGPVEQVAMVPVRITTGAPCACGCKRPKTGQSDYHDDACRVRHWKERTGYVHPDSPAARNARNGTQTTLLRRPRPGGRQAAFGVALRFIVAGLVDELGVPEARAERLARTWLTRALPTRQRRDGPRLREAA